MPSFMKPERNQISTKYLHCSVPETELDVFYNDYLGLDIQYRINAIVLHVVNLV